MSVGMSSFFSLQSFERALAALGSELLPPAPPKKVADASRKCQAWFKFILLGASGVGKTSIFNVITGSEFPDLSQTTIKPVFRLRDVMVDDVLYRLQVWDTPSTLDLHSLADAAFDDVDAFIVVYDVASKESLVAVEDIVGQLQRLIADGEANSNSSGKSMIHADALIVLAGNQADRPFELHAATHERAQMTAAKLGIVSVFELSAKTGLFVREMFTELTRQILRLRAPRPPSPKVRKLSITTDDDPNSKHSSISSTIDPSEHRLPLSPFSFASPAPSPPSETESAPSPSSISSDSHIDFPAIHDSPSSSQSLPSSHSLSLPLRSRRSAPTPLKTGPIPDSPFADWSSSCASSAVAALPAVAVSASAGTGLVVLNPRPIHSQQQQNLSTFDRWSKSLAQALLPTASSSASTSFIDGDAAAVNLDSFTENGDHADEDLKSSGMLESEAASDASDDAIEFDDGRNEHRVRSEDDTNESPHSESMSDSIRSEPQPLSPSSQRSESSLPSAASKFLSFFSPSSSTTDNNEPLSKSQNTYISASTSSDQVSPSSISSSSTSSTLCDICAEQPASTICLVCSEAQCASCTRIHSRARATRAHPLMEWMRYQQERQNLLLPNEKPATQPRSSSCSVHAEQQLSHFCPDCGQLVCVSCLEPVASPSSPISASSVENSLHSSTAGCAHSNASLVHEWLHQLRSEWRAQLKWATRQHQAILSAQRLAVLRRRGFESRTSVQLASITSMFHRLRRMLDARELQLRDAMQQSNARAHQLWEEQSLVLSQTAHRIECSIQILMQLVSKIEDSSMSESEMFSQWQLLKESMLAQLAEIELAQKRGDPTPSISVANASTSSLSSSSPSGLFSPATPKSGPIPTSPSLSLSPPHQSSNDADLVALIQFNRNDLTQLENMISSFGATVSLRNQSSTSSSSPVDSSSIQSQSAFESLFNVSIAFSSRPPSRQQFSLPAEFASVQTLLAGALSDIDSSSSLPLAEELFGLDSKFPNPSSSDASSVLDESKLMSPLRSVIQVPSGLMRSDFDRLLELSPIPTNASQVNVSSTSSLPSSSSSTSASTFLSSSASSSSSTSEKPKSLFRNEDDADEAQAAADVQRVTRVPIEKPTTSSNAINLLPVPKQKFPSFAFTLSAAIERISSSSSTPTSPRSRPQSARERMLNSPSKDEQHSNTSSSSSTSARLTIEASDLVIERVPRCNSDDFQTSVSSSTTPQPVTLGSIISFRISPRAGFLADKCKKDAALFSTALISSIAKSLVFEASSPLHDDILTLPPYGLRVSPDGCQILINLELPSIDDGDSQWTALVCDEVCVHARWNGSQIPGSPIFFEVHKM